MVALSGGNYTLSRLFKEVIDEEMQTFISALGGLRDNSNFSITVADADDKPIKGVVFEKYQGNYYAYFAKNVFDSRNVLKLDDCYTADELCILLDDPALKTKSAENTQECKGKPQILGPLTFNEAVNLKKAIDYINMAHELRSTGAKFLQRLTGKSPEV